MFYAVMKMHLLEVRLVPRTTLRRRRPRTIQFGCKRPTQSMFHFISSTSSANNDDDDDHDLYSKSFQLSLAATTTTNDDNVGSGRNDDDNDLIQLQW